MQGVSHCTTDSNNGHCAPMVHRLYHAFSLRIVLQYSLAAKHIGFGACWHNAQLELPDLAAACCAGISSICMLCWKHILLNFLFVATAMLTTACVYAASKECTKTCDVALKWRTMVFRFLDAGTMSAGTCLQAIFPLVFPPWIMSCCSGCLFEQLGFNFHLGWLSAGACLQKTKKTSKTHT